MAIKIDHSNQLIEVTNRSTPLILDAPGGIQIPSSNSPTVQAGILVFDPVVKQLKYYTGSKWVFIGSTEGLDQKARKHVADDYAPLPTGAGTFYLTGNSSSVVPSWSDPEDDGFVRFNKDVTLSNNNLFVGDVEMQGSLDMSGTRIRNIIQGGNNDAIPRSYVDSAIITASDAAVTKANAQYTELYEKYSRLIQAISGAAPLPAPNPARTYNMHYSGRTLGSNESLRVLASWAKSTARSMNGGVNPASGSTFVVTTAKQYVTSSGKNTSYGTGTYQGIFSYNGSTATLTSERRL